MPPALRVTYKSGQSVRFERIDPQMVRLMPIGILKGYLQAISNYVLTSPDDDFPEQEFYHDTDHSVKNGKLMWVYYSPQTELWELYEWRFPNGLNGQPQNVELFDDEIMKNMPADPAHAQEYIIQRCL